MLFRSRQYRTARRSLGGRRPTGRHRPEPHCGHRAATAHRRRCLRRDGRRRQSLRRRHGRGPHCERPASLPLGQSCRTADAVNSRNVTTVCARQGGSMYHNGSREGGRVWTERSEGRPGPSSPCVLRGFTPVGRSSPGRPPTAAHRNARSVSGKPTGVSARTLRAMNGPCYRIRREKEKRFLR